jgi:peroxiredoxin
MLRLSRFVVVAMLALGFALILATPRLPAADEETPGAKADAAAADAYTVPDGTPDELLKFVDKLQQTQLPSGLSFEQRKEHVLRILAAIIKASEKITAGKPAADMAATAAQLKLEALVTLDRMGDASALPRIKQYGEELKSGPQAELTEGIRRYVLGKRIMAAMSDHGPEISKQDLQKEAAAILDEVRETLCGTKPDSQDIGLTMTVGKLLQQTDQGELAAQAYREFAAFFAKSEDKQLAEYGPKLQGAARLATLIGKPIEISGTLVSGKKFDWSAYKGKVVLIDFWATWCGPCVGEIPNVKADYEKYHERGFEVVGVSLDSERPALEAFIEKEQLPWPILFSEDPQHSGWDTPLATYYGVMALPTTILVDQQGNVVTLEARGEELSERLAQLLGPGGKKLK